jgi:hypothetical protein
MLPSSCGMASLSHGKPQPGVLVGATVKAVLLLLLLNLRSPAAANPSQVPV